MGFNAAHWSPRFINKMHKRARRMIKKPTPIERKLSRILKEMALGYTAQMVISTFIVDFCLKDYPLVIEADGFATHHTSGQREKDGQRDARIKQLGYDTLRIAGWNLSHPELVKGMIRDALKRYEKGSLLTGGQTANFSTATA